MNIHRPLAALTLALLAGTAFAATTPATPATPAKPAMAAPAKAKVAHACKKGDTVNAKGKCEKSKHVG